VKSEFLEAVKILNLPKEEAAATVAGLDRDKTIDYWKFEKDIREKIFRRLMEIKAAQDEDQKDIDRYLTRHLIDGNYGHGLNDDQKKIYKIFTGKDPGKDLKDVKALSLPRQFGLLLALEYDDTDIPLTDNFIKTKKDMNDFLTWTGLPREKIKELYQEAIREALPKPKAEKLPAKKGKKK
jgi:hypothetical protein